MLGARGREPLAERLGGRRVPAGEPGGEERRERERGDDSEPGGGERIGGELADDARGFAKPRLPLRFRRRVVEPSAPGAV